METESLLLCRGDVGQVEEPARDASGTAPGQMELVGKGEMCWLSNSVVICALVAEKRNVECNQGGSL